MLQFLLKKYRWFPLLSGEFFFSLKVHGFFSNARSQLHIHVTVLVVLQILIGVPYNPKFTINLK